MEQSSPVMTFTATAEQLGIAEGEVLRYLGYGREQIAPHDVMQVQAVAKEARKVIAPRACYKRFSIDCSGDGCISFPYGDIFSRDLTKNLTGCKEVFIFAATIGIGFDRMIQRAKLQSMAKAAILQAVGATAVEDVCDLLQAQLYQEVAKENKKLRPRYSPGYGDYSLENQRGIFSVISPDRYAGITLMDTLIMAPEKSVTAIIGITSE